MKGQPPVQRTWTFYIFFSETELLHFENVHDMKSHEDVTLQVQPFNAASSWSVVRQLATLRLIRRICA